MEQKIKEFSLWKSLIFVVFFIILIIILYYFGINLESFGSLIVILVALIGGYKLAKNYRRDKDGNRNKNR